MRLRWTSALARADLQHLPLPAFVLGLGLASVLTRILRAGLVGETGRALRPGAARPGPAPGGCSCATACPTPLPGLTVLALGIGGLLGGAAAVETVFTWPGMGLYIVDAIGARDLPVVQGFALVSAAIFILVNLGPTCWGWSSTPACAPGAGLSGAPCLFLDTRPAAGPRAPA